MTPTTQRGQSQAARGQWSHVSGGGTHVPPTCKRPSRVCQDAHDSHLSGPAKTHQEAEVWASGGLRGKKLHRSNAEETHLQTRSSHLTARSHFLRQETGFIIPPSPHLWETLLSWHFDGSFQNHWVLIYYHLLLLKLLLNSAHAFSGSTERLVNRTCDGHEIRTAYCYYITWYPVVPS